MAEITDNGPSAKAASCLIDLLGAEGFADRAVEFVRTEFARRGIAPLSQEQALLVRVGALKAAKLVADELREFAGQEVKR